MYRRICTLIAVSVLVFCATEYGAADDIASMIRSADNCVAERQFDRAQALYEQAQAEGMHFGDLPHVRNLVTVYLNSTPPDLAKAIKWLQVSITLDPQSDSLRAQLAEVLYRSGNFDAAIEQYRGLTDAHPTSPEYAIPFVTALRQAGKSDAALQFLQARTETYPSLVAFRVEYARQLNFSKQFSEARKQFSAALAIAPQNLIAQVGLAKATSYEGDQESAIAMYNRILQRHPGSYDAMVGKAFSLLWSGQAEQAAGLLRRAAVRNPDDSEVRDALRTLPHSIAEAPAATPVERIRRVNTPREAALRRPANPEANLNPAPATDRTIPPQQKRALPPQEQTPPQQEQPHRLGSTIAILGLCLPLASFAYGYSRSRRFKSRRVKGHSICHDRTTHSSVSISERESESSSTVAEPEATAAGFAVTEAPDAENVSPLVAAEERSTAAPQSLVEEPTVHEEPVALPALLEPALIEEPERDIFEDEVLPYSTSSTIQPWENSGDRIEGNEPLEEILDDPFESHELFVAPRELVSKAPLKILLIGGTSHDIDLEKHWFPIPDQEILWERSWETALRCLASAPPDLIVVNSLSHDGWSSERIFNWMIANKAEFRDRTIVVCGPADASRRERECPDAYLLEPFGAEQWRQAIMGMLLSREVASW